MSEPEDPAGVPVPLNAHGASTTGLPAAAVAAGRPGKPRRRPVRTGDVVVTAIFMAVLYILVAVYVADALTRADSAEGSVPGAALANGLAEFAPIALAVFASVFAALFIARRVLAFWLPVVAALFVVALYSVTQQMIDSAVVSHLVG